MSTLSLKPNINTQLLESIQSQNEHIITLLEENNRLLKARQSSPRPANTFNDTKAYLNAINMLKEFSPGNNYNTVVKLARWCRKWDKKHIDEINNKIQSIDMSPQNKAMFLKMIAKLNG